MVISKKEFFQKRELELNDRLDVKAGHVIKHIENTLTRLISGSDARMLITIPDGEWGRHLQNSEQIRILQRYITNQYKKAGWNVVEWGVNNDYDATYTHYLKLG